MATSEERVANLTDRIRSAYERTRDATNPRTLTSPLPEWHELADHWRDVLIQVYFAGRLDSADVFQRKLDEAAR